MRAKSNGKIYAMTTKRAVKKPVRKTRPRVCQAFKCNEILQQSVKGKGAQYQGERFCRYHWKQVPKFLREDMLATYKVDGEAFDIALYKAMMSICLDESMPLLEWDIPIEAYKAWYEDERCRDWDRTSVKVELKTNIRSQTSL